MHFDIPLEQLATRRGAAFQFAFATEAKELEQEEPIMHVRAAHRRHRPAVDRAQPLRHSHARPGREGGMRPWPTAIVTEADYANLSLLDSPPLSRRLSRAVRVRSGAMPRGIVTMNSRVLCHEPAGGRREPLSLVYPQDAAPLLGRHSVLSAQGMALLGALVGQTIEWEMPNGSRRRLRIESLLYQPEHDMRCNLVWNEKNAVCPL
jgi:regulator of nucleoside diphosphate kinase